MTEREQLVRAIIDDPNDSTLRLAYADHLDENGRSDYAKYVRNKVEEKDFGLRLSKSVDIMAFESWFDELFRRSCQYFSTTSSRQSWGFDDYGLLTLEVTQDRFVEICDSGVFAHVDCVRIRLADRKPYGPHDLKNRKIQNPLWTCGWQRISVTDKHWKPDDLPECPTEYDRERYRQRLQNYQEHKNYGIHDPLFDLLEGGKFNNAWSEVTGKRIPKITHDYDAESSQTVLDLAFDSLSKACCVYGVRRHEELIAKKWKEETVEGKYQ